MANIQEIRLFDSFTSKAMSNDDYAKYVKGVLSKGHTVNQFFSKANAAEFIVTAFGWSGKYGCGINWVNYHNVWTKELRKYRKDTDKYMMSKSTTCKSIW